MFAAPFAVSTCREIFDSRTIVFWGRSVGTLRGASTAKALRTVEQ